MEISSFRDASLTKVTSKDVDQNAPIPSTSDLEKRGENDKKDASKACEPKTKMDQIIAA